VKGRSPLPGPRVDVRVAIAAIILIILLSQFHHAQKMNHRHDFFFATFVQHFLAEAFTAIDRINFSMHAVCFLFHFCHFPEKMYSIKWHIITRVFRLAGAQFNRSKEKGIQIGMQFKVPPLQNPTLPPAGSPSPDHTTP